MDNPPEIVAMDNGHYDLGASSLAVQLNGAEIDQQVATARAFPRSIERATKGILSLATLDDESAAECIYALPRGGKAIKGPSIRLAEIIASQWGNCRVSARVVHVDRVEKFVESEGTFHDLETNVATKATFRRRISDKRGHLLSDDMIIVTGNAACAIARRNAILGGVPKAVWRKAYSNVEAVIVGDIKTIVERRDGAIKAFAAYGVKPEQIYIALGVSGLSDIAADQLITLAGMYSAIKNGEETVESIFSPPQVEQKTPTIADKLKGNVGNGFNAAHIASQADAMASPAKPQEAVAKVEAQSIGIDQKTPSIARDAASGGKDTLALWAERAGAAELRDAETIRAELDEIAAKADAEADAREAAL